MHLKTTLHCIVVIACPVLHHCCVFTCFLPLSSLSVDPDTDVAPEIDAAQEPDDAVDDLALAVEQTGKHPHFEHSDIAYSLLSIACIRIALLLLYLF